MIKIVDQLLKDSGASVKWCEEIRDNLKNGKRYLKVAEHSFSAYFC